MASQTLQTADVLLALKSSKVVPALPVPSQSQSPSPAASTSAAPSSAVSITSVATGRSGSPSSSLENSPVTSRASSPHFGSSIGLTTTMGLGSGGSMMSPLSPPPTTTSSSAHWADRYSNIIRAQALLQSVYELEQMRARNELLVAAAASMSISASSSPRGGLMKPTVMKASAGSGTNAKFSHRHYGNHPQQRRMGSVSPIHYHHQRRHHHQQPMSKPVVVKPLSAPPALWKPNTKVMMMKSNTPAKKTVVSAPSA